MRQKCCQEAPVACQHVRTFLRNDWTLVNLKEGHIQQHAKEIIPGHITFYLQDLFVFIIIHTVVKFVISNHTK